MHPTSPVRVRVALTGTVVGAALVALGVIAPAVEAAPPSSYKVTGVDTSHHNHERKGRKDIPIDWKRVAASNDFAFLKATQGVSGKDGWFARDHAAVSRTSLLRAPYHFFHPRSTTDGAAQARHFVSTVRAAGYRGGRAGELPPVLDVEKLPARGGGEVCPKALRAPQVRAFLNEVKKEFGVTPIVYTRAPFVKECMGGRGEVFAGYPLWLARYGSGSDEPHQVPGAGRSWTFWQHTQDGVVPGIDGPVDRDVFRGSAAELRAMAKGGTPRPAHDFPVLRPGQRGGEVTAAQLLLAAKGHRVAADGDFGPATAAAVKRFQQGAGLEADGVIGGRTWRALAPELSSGDRGRAVEAAQRRLAAHGHKGATDGVYGAGTAANVRTFQKKAALPADGVVGARTWAALLSRP
ncbi:GH25 family lysozyme [Streptomyces sp. NPDC002669]|uniref:GH25 family lysozyme n=1 Tax=Streptomyces sp. NPDC002669 TaxID=3364658 RepID=UPI0036B3541C